VETITGHSIYYENRTAALRVGRQVKIVFNYCMLQVTLHHAINTYSIKPQNKTYVIYICLKQCNIQRYKKKGGGGTA